MRFLSREVYKIKAILLVSTIVCSLLCLFYETINFLWVLSVEWIEKYQRQVGLLSSLASVIKGLDSEMKRTHS